MSYILSLVIKLVGFSANGLLGVLSQKIDHFKVTVGQVLS
jgi:hypothetical protein